MIDPRGLGGGLGGTLEGTLGGGMGGSTGGVWGWGKSHDKWNMTWASHLKLIPRNMMHLEELSSSWW